jgi:spermidine synthase
MRAEVHNPMVAAPNREASASPEMDAFPDLCHRQPNLGIFLISIVALFLELMLIRWIGTEVRIFAYLQNTVLVVCFLGLGLGCFTCRQPVNLRQVVLPLTVLIGLLALPWTRKVLASISSLLSVLGDLVIWDYTVSQEPVTTVFFVVLGLALTYFLMIMVAEMFVPLGRILGRALDDHPKTIKGYSINVFGSLVGIWGFVALSVIDQPPMVWMFVLALMMLPLLAGMPRSGRQVALLAACVALAWFAGRDGSALSSHWTPYQKLVFSERDQSEGEVGEYLIEVNNAGYQAIVDLREEHVAAQPEKYPPRLMGYSQYDLPARFHPSPRSMLIVGAGSGNDAAGALRQGVERVVAVEIDPVIVELGRANHPEKPYESPHVEVVVDDARSYFANCDERFDVIAFGLLDSHTMTAMTNARLDHYVYTIESLRHAKSLLNDGGVIFLSFEAQKPYIADRMAVALREVFGDPPMVFKMPLSRYGWGGVMFVAGDPAAAQAQLDADPILAGLVAEWQSAKPVELSYATAPVTDDWPYLYLRSRHVPLLYYLLAVLLALLMVRFRRKLAMCGQSGPWSRTHWHFFFLGAAFLLLEVQNISKGAVVLGNTWWVNAVIISGVLSMVLLANAIAARWPNMPMKWAYAALCATCLGLYMLDLSSFAFLPFATKALVVGGLTTLPMLFSGIVFIRSFTIVESKSAALGANLMGALVGALLQSITFWVGIKALLLIVAALYLLSLATFPRPRSQSQLVTEPLTA